MLLCFVSPCSCAFFCRTPSASKPAQVIPAENLVALLQPQASSNGGINGGVRLFGAVSNAEDASLMLGALQVSPVRQHAGPCVVSQPMAPCKEDGHCHTAARSKLSPSK